jgi:hypothetical protein
MIIRSKEESERNRMTKEERKSFRKLSQDLQKISPNTKGGESDMIFSLITAGTITAAQLFAQGVTTSVVAYSIAKTGKTVRVRL